MPSSDEQDNTPKRARGRPRSQKSEPAGGTVQALERGLVLLQLLSREGESSLTDLSLQAGMPASTAHRLLGTLLKYRFVACDDASQLWSVGIGAYNIGSAYLNRSTLVEVAHPIMRRLMQETGETANLGIIEDGDTVFLSQVESSNPIRAFHPPGTRSALHASGIGKTLLSALSTDKVEQLLRKRGLTTYTEHTLTTPAALFADIELSRERGWAYDNEERYEGMRCVAAPVIDATGHAIAGVSISGPSVRFADEDIPQLGPVVRRAANDISEQLGGKRFLKLAQSA